MPQFRADFEVSSSLVLPYDSKPLELQTQDPPFHLIIRNAALDKSGHVPNLEVQIVGPCDRIEDVPIEFRAVLAEQLDLLCFTTQNQFLIKQCMRVVEWEPYQKRRVLKVFQKFDPLHPPDPQLAAEFVETAEAIAASGLDDFARHALRCFRYGVIARQPEEQFQHFWFAIETIAEGKKAATMTLINCQKCGGGLTCGHCGQAQIRRPMAMEAIRALIGGLGIRNAKAVCKVLTKTRHHLLHGRSPHEIEAKVGYPLDTIVNDIGTVAWRCIRDAMTRFDDGGRHFGHRDGQFAVGALIVGPVLVIDHDGKDEHPSDDHLPKVQVELITRFGPAPSDRSPE